MTLPKHSIFLMLLTLTTLLCSQITSAQRGYYFYSNGRYQSDIALEIGLSGGGVNCLTDIRGSKKGKSGDGFLNDFTLSKTQFLTGAYIGATFRDLIAIRADFNFGKVSAADSNLAGANNEYAKARYDRNLSFRSNIFEMAGVIELHPLFFWDYQDADPPRWSPYVLAGAGITKFNPQANLNGQWYDLQPLRLEGQGFAEFPDRQIYKKSAFTVPVGIGVRYELSEVFTVRAELTRHFLNTDYLDDVSNPDWVLDPSLFYKYLTPGQANLAVQLYNRSTRPDLNPRVNNYNPRGKNEDKDTFWSFMIKFGVNINRIL